jgi:hypothetical protein
MGIEPRKGYHSANAGSDILRNLVQSHIISPVLRQLKAHFVSTTRPSRGRAHVAKLLENGLQRNSDVERNLGDHVARYDDNAGIRELGDTGAVGGD